MLHLYELHGDRLAFDSESGALHLLDHVSWDVLSACAASGGPRPDPVRMAALERKFGSEAAACLDEANRLVADGSLFRPAEQVDLSHLYPEDPPVKAMCLHVSHDCNLRCAYCFAGTGDFGTGRRLHMTSETGRMAVDFLIRASGRRVNLDLDFFGGEPLLNWPLVEELTRYCQVRGTESGKRIRLTLTTNATLLDERKMAFLDEHMDNVVLSLDGRPEIHDRMRPRAGGQPSCHDVTERILAFLQRRGSRQSYVRGTFTRMNPDFDRDVLHLASLGITAISMEPVVLPDGHPLALGQDDLPAVEAAYDRLALAMDRMRQEGRGFRFFHFDIDLEDGPCALKRLKGCGAGCEYVAVTPDGDIYPCHQFVGETPFRLGTLRDAMASDNPRSTLDPSLRRRFADLLPASRPECLSCFARRFCSGGCAANSYHASGDIRGLYPLGCALQKKRLECALWLKAREGCHKEESA